MATLIDCRDYGDDTTIFTPIAHVSVDGHVVIPIENDDNGGALLYVALSPLEVPALIEALETSLKEASGAIAAFLAGRE